MEKKREANKPWPNITANLIRQGGLGAVPGFIGLGIVSGWGEGAFLQAWMSGGVWKIWPRLRSHEGPTGLAAGSEARHMVFCFLSLSTVPLLSLQEAKTGSS